MGMASNVPFMFKQVPSSTYFHALACLSVLDVPAQVVPGPAAQSFLPAMATPKHFSWGIFAACALSEAPAVRPAKARAANVVVVNLDTVITFLKSGFSHCDVPIGYSIGVIIGYNFLIY